MTVQAPPTSGGRQVQLGGTPTAIEELTGLSPSARTRLFCKREDRAGSTYGGNKVRKLQHLLAQARHQDAPVLTVGAIGSHHVVATAWYGRQLGIDSYAVLGPQPDTEHVRQHGRIAAGLLRGLWPTRSWAHLPLVMARAAAEVRQQRGRTPLVVPPGGSSVIGCLGSVDLGLEIGADVAAGHLPEPAQVFVPVGSGGTAAGLWVGLRAAGLSTQVVGVRTAQRVLANRAHLRALAGRIRRHLSWRLPIPLRHNPLHLDQSQVGRGYGYLTVAGVDAARQARQQAGLELEQTYGAKALAGCLAAIDRGETGDVVLFVATANSHSLEPLLTHALEALPEDLAALLQPAASPVAD